MLFHCIKKKNLLMLTLIALTDMIINKYIERLICQY